MTRPDEPPPGSGYPPLTAGTIDSSQPSVIGVSSPPVNRMLSEPTNTLT